VGGTQQGFEFFYSSLACGMLGFCQIIKKKKINEEVTHTVHKKLIY
jgi:hypothetical protein